MLLLPQFTPSPLFSSRATSLMRPAATSCCCLPPPSLRTCAATLGRREQEGAERKRRKREIAYRWSAVVPPPCGDSFCCWTRTAARRRSWPIGSVPFFSAIRYFLVSSRGSALRRAVARLRRPARHRPARRRPHLLLPAGPHRAGCLPALTSELSLCDSTRVSRKTNKEHHLWIRKDSAGSGKKALHLVNTVSKLPNEKEAVYGALDRWIAFELEFPIIAAAKALEMLKRRRQWLRIIQVTKWLMNKGQVLTWTTYDTLLLALFMDGRVDEAETIWNTIIQTHTRSVPKRLFSRMIQMYDSRHLPDKVLEVISDWFLFIL